MLKKIVRNFVPKAIIDHFRPTWNAFKEAKFQKQDSIHFDFHGFDLELPKKHPLPGLLAAQPYRDLCIGIVAKHVSEKYPTESMIDIGANIGDTAALIARYSSNPLILVEGSDFFSEYLTRNAKKLNNECEIRKVLISDGNAITGELRHWGGTAEFKETINGPAMETVALGDITRKDVCFIKTDTDGHDFRILTCAIEWIGSHKPAILFESQVRNENDLAAANELIGALADKDYQYFIIWDAAGYHLLSTSDLGIVFGMHRHLLKTQGTPAGSRACNLDVACFHRRDGDIFEKVSKWWAAY